MALEVTGYDDRSGLPEPGPHSFGYVYFSDGRRAGYALSTAGHDDIFEPRTDSGGRYRSITHGHVALARAFLKDKGVIGD